MAAGRKYWIIAAVFAASGCQQVFGLEQPRLGDAGVNDGADAKTDPPRESSLCFGAGFPVCLVSLPTVSIVFSSARSVDTDSDAVCTPTDQPGVCAIVATSITFNAVITFTGSRPVVVLATDSIIVDGMLDASSRRGVSTGAGEWSGCGAGLSPGSGGGGAGGSLGGVGGDGGGGVGIGGTAAAVMPFGMHGGCPGQTGGGALGGAGGHGGGAVYLIASSIQIGASGTIRANGAGGSGGATSAGGGGGGSGGLIGFDAMQVTNQGTVFANGGGGGEGASSTGNLGDFGDDPMSATNPALGGALSTSGGDGGAGAAGALVGGPGGTGVAGGASGGGGGGAGVVKVFGAASLTGTVSPAPS